MKTKTECVPFLRWAGGKTWFIPIWKKLVAKLSFNRYFEPFLGSGTMFFSLPGIHHAFLSDVNPQLILTYEMVMRFPDKVYAELRKFKNTKEDYYQIRGKKFRRQERIAAQFIYLNQTSFNGIYRVNAQGQYNVPYGFRTTWTYSLDRLTNPSAFLNRQQTELSVGDFEECINGVSRGDLVFLDPPYAVSERGGENLFVKYNERIFSLEDQLRLRRAIDMVKKREAFFVLTNAGHPTIERLFATGDTILELSRPCLIGGRNSQRGSVKEIAITNIPTD